MTLILIRKLLRDVRWPLLAVCAVLIPAVCLSLYAGTRVGLVAVGPFTLDYTVLKTLPIRLPVPAEPEVLAVDVSGYPAALANVAALMFAASGLTMVLSAAGRSRW